MMNRKSITALFAGAFLAALLNGCGGGGGSAPPPVRTTYTLTVASSNPASGVSIAVSPADNSGQGNGTTGLSRTYNEGTAVTLTAPGTTGSNSFSSWSGCASMTTMSCHVNMNANITVTATYSPVTGITITPNPVTLKVGDTQQFTFNVAGSGTFDHTVTWSVNGIAGGNATVGTITTAGLYVTPFPVPSSITVTATSNLDSTKSGSAVVNINVPIVAGPALTVDAGVQTHAISPLIYGMNFYTLNSQAAKDVRLSVDRWGGDATTRYNYLLDITNSANDWYFETDPNSNAAYPDVSDFNSQVAADKSNGTLTLGTVPLIGWTTRRPANNARACGFSVAKYGAQQKNDPYYTDCGNGLKTDGVTQITGNDPTDTSTPIDETFVNGWVKYLAGKFGDAAHGGVSIYDLDNEPEWWAGVHRDVHPTPMSYDELTNKGLSYAKAVKDADPTAEVSGPVISFWMDFFYSYKDITTGWGSGPYYVANGNPVDRLAHGDVPLIEYYLQQFKKYQDSNGVRLLDYVDLHTYFAAAGAQFATAGTTDLQKARLDSTRVLWDPSYTDPAYTDPDNRTNSAKPLAPQLIPRIEQWVASDYPGTKTAITEYNWGGQEHINGAVAQADILGIFGREGLDLGTLWGPPDPATQMPGLIAFEIYRNYDGAGSGFGDMALVATSGDQSQLSVYGALRTSDGVVTVMVINKSFADQTATLSLANLTAAGPAKVYQYSNLNLSSISALADQAVTPPPTGSTTSTLAATFPAQSITLFVIPK
jgi:hypothetical protein